MSLTIVGGTYIESVDIPFWYELYGSACRAAVAVSSFAEDVTLNTLIDEGSFNVLEQTSKTFNFALESQLIKIIPEFNYLHPLSKPDINPLPSSFKDKTKINIESDNVLRFGMLDGDPVVRGKYVVYDPQSINPEMYQLNGSTAEHLAVVANYRESSILADSGDVDTIGKNLIDRGVEVVIVKRGIYGATLFTKDIKFEVPVYVTDSVWKIGSGDVFSAMFAFYWAVSREDPVKSAVLASKATASYCNTKILPISSYLIEQIEESSAKVISEEIVNSQEKKIYLAGPFFNLSQRWMIENVRKVLLDEGLEVFSPLHDVGLTNEVELIKADLDAIKDCSVMLAVCENFDPGTLVEIGYARALNIPVIVYYNNNSEDDLLMLRASGAKLFDDLTSAIYHTAWMAF